MQSDTPSHDSDAAVLPSHHPLPAVITRFDYALTVVFLGTGPFFYYAQTARAMGYSTAGEAISLTLQLALHFMAAYYFLTSHFMDPMTFEVRTVIALWRLVLLIATVVLGYGFWQFQAGF